MALHFRQFTKPAVGCISVNQASSSTEGLCLSFVDFIKPGGKPSVDLASDVSMKLEFPGLSPGSI